MNLTLIEGSPRRGGNTATLAASLARQLQRSGSAVQRFSVAEQHFAPCTGCNACLDTGECVQRSEGDATGELYAALDTCDALLWVTPLYFAGVPAQLKALIDRFQIYYGRRLADGGAGEPGGQAPWSHISCRSVGEGAQATGRLTPSPPTRGTTVPVPPVLRPLRRPAAAIIIGAGGDPFGAQAAVTILRSASQMAEFTLADPLVIEGPDGPEDILEERFAEERVAARLLVEALQEQARAHA